MNNVIDKAIVFAANAHTGQVRKGTSIPYVFHPVEAGAVVATMTDDREIIAAAVLHDVIEDTDVVYDEIKAAFGTRIAELVLAESENKRENLSAASTWKIRKQETLDHLITAPKAVKMIALGDKLSNIRAIFRDYKSIGDDLWQRFNQKNKCEQGWYYRSIAACLFELNEHQAYKEYDELVNAIFGVSAE